MNLGDEYLTDFFRITYGFTLINENNNLIKGETLKGKYFLVLYIKDVYSAKGIELLSYFNDKIKALDSQDTKYLFICDLKPVEISSLKEKYGLQISLFSAKKPNELTKIGIAKQKVTDRIAILFDRWGMKRQTWREIENEKQVSEIFKMINEIVNRDKLISRLISLRRARRSLRKQKIPRKVIEQLIRAAHLAPSCFNKQPWRFIAVDDSNTHESLHEYIPEGNSWMRNAPVLLIVYSKEENDCQLSDNRVYYLFDTGLAVGMLLVQATKMGLVAHPVAGYKPKKFKEILDLPEDSVLITVIAVGYQGESSLLDEKNQKEEISGRKRKSVESVFHWYR